MSDSTASLSNLPALSVSELSQAIKRTMETTFDRVRVRGELGRVTIAKSGHLYADVKDENAVLNVVMWKGQVSALKFRPEEGLEVVVEGRISSYPGRSAYQLLADRMEPAGVGALLAQLEKLKARLAAEGLFAAERKRPLPFLPEVIGVITSPTGAVIRDILHRLNDRFPRRVLLWPVLVQGEQAARQVADAIAGFNALPPGGAAPRPDVLIVARGGGSIEDLWAFNEEIVVRAAAASAIPLISAVGHETDTTLIDFASDLRAPTPTGAAEKAVPVRAELIAKVEMLAGRKKAGLARGLELRRSELRAAAARLPRPGSLLETAQQRFDRAAERLIAALHANVKAHRARLDNAAAALRPTGLRREIERRGERLEAAGKRLAPALVRSVKDKATEVQAASRLLETLSHRSVLARGFALVRDASGAVVRSAGAAPVGSELVIAFADGDVRAEVTGASEDTTRPGQGSDGGKRNRKSKPSGRASEGDGGDQGVLL